MPKNKDDLVRWGDVETAIRQFHREQTMSKYSTKADCDLARRMVLWTLYQLEHVPTVTAEKGKTMAELKPCPFCGGEAKLKQSMGEPVVVCTQCWGAMWILHPHTAEQAIEAWNRRADNE